MRNIRKPTHDKVVSPTKIDISKAVIRIHAPRSKGDPVSIIEKVKDRVKAISMVRNIYKLRN